ncbi:hypothetical protein Barb4_02463 [Bacteroidales bacterium Barb4]|nr:hypothetical protein Barb4_02463 [Bacteroidales bacterium Barb4]
MRAGYLVHDHVDDGLREAYAIARHGCEVGSHIIDKVAFTPSVLPRFVGLQSDGTFHVRGGEGFRSLVVATDLCHYIRHFLVAGQPPAQSVAHFTCFIQRKSGRHLHLQPDTPFVQRREEVFSHRCT